MSEPCPPLGQTEIREAQHLLMLRLLLSSGMRCRII